MEGMTIDAVRQKIREKPPQRKPGGEFEIGDERGRTKTITFSTRNQTQAELRRVLSSDSPDANFVMSMLTAVSGSGMPAGFPRTIGPFRLSTIEVIKRL